MSDRVLQQSLSQRIILSRPRIVALDIEQLFRLALGVDEARRAHHLKDLLSEGIRLIGAIIGARPDNLFEGVDRVAAVGVLEAFDIRPELLKELGFGLIELSEGAAVLDVSARTRD